MVSTLNPLTSVGFLDWNCRYNSVDSQISHNAGLALIPNTGRNFYPTWDRTSAVSCNRAQASTPETALPWSRDLLKYDQFKIGADLISKFSA